MAGMNGELDAAHFKQLVLALDFDWMWPRVTKEYRRLFYLLHGAWMILYYRGAGSLLMAIGWWSLMNGSSTSSLCSSVAANTSSVLLTHNHGLTCPMHRATVVGLRWDSTSPHSNNRIATTHDLRTPLPGLERVCAVCIVRPQKHCACVMHIWTYGWVERRSMRYADAGANFVATTHVVLRVCLWFVIMFDAARWWR